eukprot:GHVO01063196.1.p1 GENE.GHVO01063196.1~~GHVO01063196.1.p1  ORF type:complete len:318 (-),score=68.18 GHVO01063196.1:83-1009(-)
MTSPDEKSPTEQLRSQIEDLSINDTTGESATTASLRDLHKQHLDLEGEYRAEWNALKAKYLTLYSPIYTQRKDILNGDADGDAVGTKNIPGFWLRAMQNQRVVNEMIEEYDEPILQYLQDLRFEWLDETAQTSFRLIFEFSTNPYFENKILTKTYNMDKDDSGDSVLSNTLGTEIQWRPGKDTTKKKVTKKQRHKRTHQTRTVEDVIDMDSFFNLFNSNEIPTEAQLTTMNERLLDDLEMVVEADFEVGCTLREKIIPRAFGWYMGEEHDTDDDNEESSSISDSDGSSDDSGSSNNDKRKDGDADKGL